MFNTKSQALCFSGFKLFFTVCTGNWIKCPVSSREEWHLFHSYHCLHLIRQDLSQLPWLDLSSLGSPCLLDSWFSPSFIQASGNIGLHCHVWLYCKILEHSRKCFKRKDIFNDISFQYTDCLHISENLWIRKLVLILFLLGTKIQILNYTPCIVHE